MTLFTRRAFVATVAAAFARARAWAQETPVVQWMWLGACTADSAVVKARALVPGAPLTLVVTAKDGRPTVPGIELTRAADEYGVATFALTGLREKTAYRYAVTAPGGAPLTGTFKTFGNGAFSFRMVFASCASTGSESAVFDHMRALRPDLFIHMGDLHYSNIRRNEVARFARAYARVLTSRTQGPLFRSVPIAYMWDDHDCGPNDADGTSPSRPAALASYRAFVPHYTLSNEPAAAIHQAFSVGRVRIVMTDTRSARSPRTRPVAERTMLGAEQLAWLFAELEAAATAPLVIWVNTVPWITKRDEGTVDGWAPYALERQRIANAIVRLGLTDRLLMLSGDAHMLAIDDGTNSQYATGAASETHGFVVVQAAPMDRRPTMKGGPYSVGYSRANGQFGLMDVADDGQTIRVSVQGRRGGEAVPGMRIDREYR